jgi:tRNA pseudouridine synthase 10
LDDVQVALLKQYKLCKHCLERLTGTGKFSEPCYICCGLMDNLADIANSMVAAVRGYEFETFLIGATLSAQLYEREDAVRARLKIRGRESIKNHLTREIGMQFALLAGKKVEYIKPDIRISLTIDKENNIGVEVISRPLVLAGVYIKKSRGLPQKQEKCTSCAGSGCNLCSYSGLSGYDDSVEGVIAKKLVRITRGRGPKFTWIGSEDQRSLVLGRGRPFYVRVFNPKKRKVKNKIIKGNSIIAMLHVINEQPRIQPRFTVETRIHIKCERALTKKDLKKLNSISGSMVRFENKSKMAVKRIYSTRVRWIDSNQFMLTIVADGGLMIKQFVGGEEYMKPNISEILGDKCECVTFDILDVKVQQGFSFGEAI